MFRTLTWLVCIVMLSLATSVSIPSNASEAVQGSPGYLLEEILVSIDCSVATVYTACLIRSNTSIYIHYPSAVDMSNAHLENAIAVLVWFNRTESNLLYIFNNTDLEKARDNADVITPSISSAFGVDFTWRSTNPSAHQVRVTYIGDGVPNLVGYVGTLKSNCLKSDLGGFSSVFTSLIAKSLKSKIGLAADKKSETFDWNYRFIVSYVTDIAVGTSDHTINVLNLLGVPSLSPSKYACANETYVSTATLEIDSSSPISFKSCEPPEVFPPIPYLRGWNVEWNPVDYPNKLRGVFYFGDDPTPVSSLKLAFGSNSNTDSTPNAQNNWIFAVPLIIIFLICIAYFVRRRKKRKPKKFKRVARLFSGYPLPSYPL